MEEDVRKGTGLQEGKQRGGVNSVGGGKLETEGADEEPRERVKD